MPRERALACAVRLLDLGFFRVGGEEYAETNESYGAGDDPARARHRRATARWSSTSRPRAASAGCSRSATRTRSPAIEAMRRRRSGPDDLLAYREGGGWRDVRSDDVNAYIQEKIGDGVLGQGLPHLERHRPRRGRARRRAEAASPRPPPSARSPPRSRASPRRSATPRRSAAAPTSTRASSTATATASRSRSASPAAVRSRRAAGPGSSAPCSSWSPEPFGPAGRRVSGARTRTPPADSIPSGF